MPTYKQQYRPLNHTTLSNYSMKSLTQHQTVTELDITLKKQLTLTIMLFAFLIVSFGLYYTLNVVTKTSLANDLINLQS